MDRTAAKELLHIQGWLERVDEISVRGIDAYLADALLQEAGDSLMMKVGELLDPDLLGDAPFEAFSALASTYRRDRDEY